MAHHPESDTIKIIAHIQTEFNTKFGVPRQSGLIDSLRGRIVFEPEYRIADALRGIEGFSHLWLIWQFSEARRDNWSPTVRPPRLGGNTRMGVFATRSPFRPNAIGLSSVKLIDVDYTSPDAPAIIVAGADLMNGTPIIDIKPYLPYTDSHPDASGGFTDTNTHTMTPLKVNIPEALAARLGADTLAALQGTLACDPRPRYQHDPERIYGMVFANREVKFKVDGETATVISID
ncbi:MAG: tRNA (N6-threonylcarbamoyladenosine(37)-N6)-methyltransferase TrmO [Muribaculaceae bacterium]